MFRFTSLAAACAVALILSPVAARAQDKLVVSIWGGNWKDGANEAIAKEFTKRTGMGVEFVTGGTMDRLTKAKVDRGHPEADVTFTTSHVSYLYQSDGLYEKLDMSKLPNAKELYPAADRSPYYIGLYSYVYTPAFRTDLMPKGFKISSWRDLWSPALKGKLGLPDFDPSHIIIVAAMLSGGDAKNWKVGIPLLEKLKPNIKTFYQSDATSQDLMKTGETPVQVLLSINAYHQISQGIPIQIDIPKEGAVVGIDAVGISKGTKHLDAAYKFINTALDPSVQQHLCELYKCSPMNMHAKLSPDLAKLPGIFTSPEQWKTEAIVVDDEVRAKDLPEWKSWFTENMMH
ncbi:MAG TPA: ABC transporter substrate-binding protein [Alphaproteobacteria bacterium]|nr:ABC transporter substrate-binding protein [Alphaproteobacteria bacterium]